MPRLAHRLGNLLIVFLSAAGLSAAGGLLYLQYSLRGTLEQQVGERLGTPVQVGFARVGLFPWRLHLAGIDIRNPEGFQAKHFLKAQDLDLQVGSYERYARLIHSPLMTINGMRVWIEREGRRSNSGVIQDNLRRFDRRHGVSRRDKTQFIIRELRIRDLTAELRVGSGSSEAEVPEIVLRNVGAGRGGVTIGELADIVTRAALRAVLKSEFERELDRRKQEKKQELGRRLERLLD
jgi:hypothetical protein